MQDMLTDNPDEDIWLTPSLTTSFCMWIGYEFAIPCQRFIHEELGKGILNDLKTHNKQMESEE